MARVCMSGKWPGVLSKRSRMRPARPPRTWRRASRARHCSRRRAPPLDWRRAAGGRGSAVRRPPVVRLAERRAQAQLAHVGRGIGGRWAAEAGAEDRQALPGEVALDAQHATGVAFEEENPQVLGNAGVVEHQVRFIVVYLQADAMEGEGQVEVAQAQLRGAEEGRAAEQGEAPDAVGVEVIAQACRQARRAGVAQVPDQVAHYAQFLGRVDFPEGSPSRRISRPLPARHCSRPRPRSMPNWISRCALMALRRGDQGGVGMVASEIDRKSQLYRPARP